MGKLKDQLAGVAALIAAIIAIGGGFVKYGEVMTKLDSLSSASAPDLSGIENNSFSINDNATALAVLEQKIAALENKKVAKPVDISGVVTRSKINEKSIKLLELQIEEIKQSSNPLGG